MNENGAVGPGKRIQPARPFMARALEETAPEAVAVVAASLKEDIESDMKA